jgi:hypothetical protein
MQLGMGQSNTIHNGLVVSKHVTCLADWYTQVAKGIAKINHLIYTSMSSNEFGPICSCLNSSLLLGIPINQSLIEQVQNASDNDKWPCNGRGWHQSNESIQCNCQEDLDHPEEYLQ